MARFKQEVENSIKHEKELDKSKRIMEAKNLIGNKKYREVASAAMGGRNYTDLELDALFNFGWGMDFFYDGDIDRAKSYFSDIPENYSGVFAKEIKEAKLQVMKTTSQKENTKENKTVMNSEHPKIGMTDYELINSTWGEPKDINKTTTANGVYEQWFYDNGKYIYIENHYVVAIQE